MSRLQGFQKGLPYQVRYGYMLDNSACFATFREALEEYRKHKGEPSGAAMVNLDKEDIDCDQDGFYQCSDGLTDEEREQL